MMLTSPCLPGPQYCAVSAKNVHPPTPAGTHLNACRRLQSICVFPTGGSDSAGPCLQIRCTRALTQSRTQPKECIFSRRATRTATSVHNACDPSSITIYATCFQKTHLKCKASATWVGRQLVWLSACKPSKNFSNKW